MVPTHVFHADWGSSPKKRWLAHAVPGTKGGYFASNPMPVKDHRALISFVRQEIGQRGCALLGFDFPIGIPLAYARAAGIKAFRPFLAELGEERRSDFCNVAVQRSEISIRRPFYPFRPGGTSQRYLLEALRVASIDELRRECEKKHDGRKAACPLFWTLGANQVGKAAISGWRDVLAPAIREGNDVLLWPFDGHLHSLLLPGKIVVAETYPAEYYGWLFSQPLRGKRKQNVRKTVGGDLIRNASPIGVELEPELTHAIEQGFPEGDDPFDAFVGLMGMLEVLRGRRSPGELSEGNIRRLEGWILGQAILG